VTGATPSIPHPRRRSASGQPRRGRVTLYLGVDGGGTHTRAVVVDAIGAVRGRGVAGAANQDAVGTAPAAQAVLSAARAAIAAARTGSGDGGAGICAAARVGLAGVDHPADVATLLPYLAPLARRVHLSNDAELLLEALPAAAAGIALIAGTGSIALGRSAAGEVERAGGWGHLFGDEGSGYGLGADALRAVARAADGREPPTTLTAAILKAWSLAEPAALIPHVYALAGKAAIARLAPLVLAAAEAGDAAAVRIVGDQARELAHTALAVAGRVGHDGRAPLPVALGGGLLLHAEAYRAQVLAALERAGCRAHPVTLVADPALTAARAARSGAENPARGAIPQWTR